MSDLRYFVCRVCGITTYWGPSSTLRGAENDLIIVSSCAICEPVETRKMQPVEIYDCEGFLTKTFENREEFFQWSDDNRWNKGL